MVSLLSSFLHAGLERLAARHSTRRRHYRCTPSLTDQLTAEPQPLSPLVASSRQPSPTPDCPEHPSQSISSPRPPPSRPLPAHQSGAAEKNNNNNIVSLAGAWKTQRLTSKSVYLGDALALQMSLALCSRAQMTILTFASGQYLPQPHGQDRDPARLRHRYPRGERAMLTMTVAAASCDHRACFYLSAIV